MIGGGSPKGVKIELEIAALQLELLRSRALQYSFRKLGIDARPFLAFRRLAIAVSVAVIVLSAIVEIA